MLVVDSKDVSMIKEIIPEINMICDEATRDKIARIWAYAWRKSSWTNLTDVCYKTELPHLSLLDHIRVLIHSCDAIVNIEEKIKGVKLNRQLLYTLILLHDVSKLVEFEKKDGHYGKSIVGKQIQHGFFGAHLALIENFSWEVIHLILTHTSQSKMTANNVEGLLFRHIDEADESVSSCHLLGIKHPE